MTKLSNEQLLSYFTSTKPANRGAAEQAFIDYYTYTHKRDFSIDPIQFIWVRSPQAGYIISKLLNSMHESTSPHKPDRSSYAPSSRTQLPPREPDIRVDIETTPITIMWTRESLSTDFRLGFGSPLHDFFERTHQQIAQSLTTNPNLDLYEYNDARFDTRNKPKGEISHLIEDAIQNSEPHISEIQLDPIFYGRRLQLRLRLPGQFLVMRARDSSRGPYFQNLENRLAACCGPVWDYGRFVILSERPKQFHYTDNNRPATVVEGFDQFRRPTRTILERRQLQLHHPSEAAIQWADGSGVYAINGVAVPHYVVTAPQKITRYRINDERNLEVRRIMIDRYKLGEEVHGAPRYLIDSNPDILDHDEAFGTLYRLSQSRASLRAGGWGAISEDEHIVVLEVVNRTPEPDGHYKHYFIRVPPTTGTAREAAAWTFGMEPDEYNPLQES